MERVKNCQHSDWVSGGDERAEHEAINHIQICFHNSSIDHTVQNESIKKGREIILNFDPITERKKNKKQKTTYPTTNVEMVVPMKAYIRIEPKFLKKFFC